MKGHKVEIKGGEWYKLGFCFKADKDCGLIERRIFESFFRAFRDKTLNVYIADTHLTLNSFNGKRLK